ncbi:MAG: hypothetical protein M1828_000194 [Chrysothrix sp. TS-e1954]|nr:MAG: hypothetical protein M1828_000194 [Chrysothrix sp. TS-e1954]
MMIRLRRYRAFIAVAVFFVVGLYYLSDGWSGTVSSPALNRARTQKPLVEPLVESPEDNDGVSDAKRPASEPEHFADAPIVKGPDAKPAEDFPQIELPGAPTTTALSSSSLPSGQVTSSSSLLDIFPHPGKPTSFGRNPLDPFANVGKATASTSEATPTTAAAATPEITSTQKPTLPDLPEDQGRIELPTISSTSSAIHWSKMPERYGIPSSSMIQLPTGHATMPRVQYQFEPEVVINKAAREKKRETIKESFLRHWQGYKKYAWHHDELRPVTGRFTDPFAGWRATLVDSLDVLWIMGLKDEFEEAVEAVKEIDFTTTRRDRLPLFEVSIRYLGGLVAAYDVSGMQYPVLLEKAKELGEILYVAFDTPNRMPQTHFGWRPEDVAKPHVGSRAGVLAEVGSLSMEFTRLSQLTKDPKYYDAIARVTDELAGYQNNTKLPGLWPMYIDLSGGCETVRPPTTSPSPTESNKHSDSSESQDSKIKFAPPMKQPLKGLLYDHTDPDAPALDTASDPRKGKDESTFGTDRKNAKPAEGPDAEADYHKKDDSTFGIDRPSLAKRLVEDDGELEKIPCEPKPIGSMSSSDKFTMGSMADSAYEYLPKEFLLLGGKIGQYKTMYDSMMKAMQDYLLYRPMIDDQTRRILFTGSFNSNARYNETTGRYEGRLDPETGHLWCFLGAFIGLGAKIWDQPKELDLAEQLTDGCVWAYESQVSGIMPEIFIPTPCETLDEEPCEWNQTAWWQAIDPNAEERLRQSEAVREMQAKMSASLAAAPTLETSSSSSASASPTSKSNTLSPDLSKRQLEDDLPAGRSNDASDNAVKKPSTQREKVAGSDSQEVSEQPTRTKAGLHLGPPGSESRSGALNPIEKATGDVEFKRKTLEEVMETRIKLEGLAPGVSRNADRTYRLRPEAIESVFYMYRITGSEKWREKGWAMFTAIEKATKAEYGSSMIMDVTSNFSPQTDSAESFWTAETLKYFYLLFSEPDLLSLDDWALNTEAHPFRRPDARQLDPDRP